MSTQFQQFQPYQQFPPFPPFQTATKNSYQKNIATHTTSHKADFSFSSPKQNQKNQNNTTTMQKQPFMQSRRVDTMRNRVQLFTEMKQNMELVTMINKSYSKQFVEQMKTQQRVEVEKLLLQISRLHDLLQDQERMHRHAINRLKQQSEQIALLRISNLKQNQFTQIETIQLQLRKTREALDVKTQMFQQLERSTSRSIQNLSKQNQGLKADLKQLLEKKNLELYQLRNQYNKQSQENRSKRQDQIQEMKDFAQKQLKKILKKLTQKQNQIQSLKKHCEASQSELTKSHQLFQKQKQQLSSKIEKIIDHQHRRQEQIKQNLQIFYEAENKQVQQNLQQQRELFMAEIEQLMKIIEVKDREIKRQSVWREVQKAGFKMQIQSLQGENSYLKKLVYEIKQQALKEIQSLKVKMGVLHKADLQALVNLYEAKIQTLTKDLQYAEKQSEKLMNQSKKQRETLYAVKKKYDYTISFLNQQLLELRTGASSTQRDMKQRLDNQKSMMMLTSRNFIKQSQQKNNNIRFYEQELRKLRQLLEIQAQEVQQSEKNVQQKIKLAQDQLGRLSNKIIQVKSQAEQTEKKLKNIIEEKNQEIKRLNQQMRNIKVVDDNGFNLRDQIKRLDQQIAKKQDQIRTLRNKYEQLQSTMRLIKSQNEKLQIEAQINSEDAKKKYKTISDKNLADMKAFYQRRLQQLENDKKQLNRIISSQSEQITQLIKKYKELEQSMKILLRQVKKRGDLQTRIVQIGMDNNLVKNMAELFHK